jgi:glycosyltransferase involved in cell wall biosynthesis
MSVAARAPEGARHRVSEDVTVVVPARNAEHLIEDCLHSISAAGPREIIVVDGESTDRTVELARRYPVRILTDGGAGLPAARRLGAEAANGPLVALIDADVVLPEGTLERLLAEFDKGGYVALQAGLESVSNGSGYWGRALAFHHRSGRSRHWFGLVATIFEREALLEHGFDDRFSSGEDIDLRWRLLEGSNRIGVSRSTLVKHRFDDHFEFAKGQWLADGAGLGRMVASRGVGAAKLFALPAAAAARGIAVSLLRLQPRWIPYFLCFMAYNYAGLLPVLWGRLRR